VIKTRIVPVRRIVAVLALLAAASVVFIVIGVATVAICGRLLENLCDVATETVGFCMLADQGIVRGVVIECDLEPVSFAMAVHTFRPKTVFVYVIFEVAADTIARGLAMLNVRNVTADTRSLGVLAKQLEIREIMVECVLVQTKNVGISTFVIRVAGGTFIASDSIRSSVKTCAIGDIAGNILMTIKAERSLLSPVEQLVAGRTFCFELCMALYNIAGHHQRLNGLSSSGVTYETSEHHKKAG